MEPSQLYDEDFLLWTEQQAAALRQLGRSNALDIDHLAEEIEDLGKRDLREVESLIELIFLHAVKIITAPDNQAAHHRSGEIKGFQSQLRRAFSPSMHRKLEMHILWQDALARLADAAPPGETYLVARVTGAMAGAPVDVDYVTARSFNVADFLGLCRAQFTGPDDRIPA